MLQPRSIQSSLSLRDKIFSIDYILVFSILVLGITSMFAMYSTDGGEILFHTKNHFVKLAVFFPFLPAPHKTNVFNGLYESFKK